MAIRNCRGNADPGRKVRGPHLRAPIGLAPGLIRIDGARGALTRFKASTSIDPSDVSSVNEAQLQALLINVGGGLNKQREGDFSYHGTRPEFPWVWYRTADKPRRGRHGLVPALAIALTELVEFCGATNAALVLLSSRYSSSSVFPGDIEASLGVRDGSPPDGLNLVRRLAQRLWRIRSRQRSQRGYPDGPPSHEDAANVERNAA